VRGPDDDDAPTVPMAIPQPSEPPGIPGLDYMPRPDDGRPPTAPARDGGEPRRPWPWLAGVAALAVLAAVGAAWAIGGITDVPPPDAAPTAEPVVPSLPDVADAPPATAPDFTTVPPSPATPSRSVTTPPAPSVTSVAPTRPQLVRVPGVVGERRPAAESTLRRAGFAVSVRLVPAPSGKEVRRVIAQQPLAGQQARPGSAVVLLVGDR
jgi:hypothetical protein